MSWKIITTHPCYEVSDAGEVRNSKTGRILKPGNDCGYHQVNLCINGIKTSIKIHRLVALYHLENPENKSQIDHIDRNKINNNVTNLRWVTNGENLQNRNYWAIKTDGNHNIWRTQSHTFTVQFQKDGIYTKKTFKTLEEAIVYRDKYITDNPR
jgi:hypothetical protein